MSASGLAVERHLQQAMTLSNLERVCAHVSATAISQHLEKTFAYALMTSMVSKIHLENFYNGSSSTLNASRLRSNFLRFMWQNNKSLTYGIRSQALSPLIIGQNASSEYAVRYRTSARFKIPFNLSYMFCEPLGLRKPLWILAFSHKTP